MPRRGLTSSAGRANLRANIAREIAKDLVRRGWLPCLVRGRIEHARQEAQDSVADETWQSMVELLDKGGA